MNVEILEVDFVSKTDYLGLASPSSWLESYTITANSLPLVRQQSQKPQPRPYSILRMPFTCPGPSTSHKRHDAAANIATAITALGFDHLGAKSLRMAVKKREAKMDIRTLEGLR